MTTGSTFYMRESFIGLLRESVSSRSSFQTFSDRTDVYNCGSSTVTTYHLHLVLALGKLNLLDIIRSKLWHTRLDSSEA